MRKNPLTKGILIINIFMFAMSAVFSGGSFLKSLWSGGDLQTLLKSGASFGAYVQQGQVYRLVSSLFLHAGLIHLIFNSYALYMFGTIVESIFGSRRFYRVYLASGFVGALLTQLFYPGLYRGRERRDLRPYRSVVFLGLERIPPGADPRD